MAFGFRIAGLGFGRSDYWTLSLTETGSKAALRRSTLPPGTSIMTSVPWGGEVKEVG